MRGGEERGTKKEEDRRVVPGGSNREVGRRGADVERGYLTWTALPGGGDRESRRQREEEVIGSSATEVYLAGREREGKRER